MPAEESEMPAVALSPSSPDASPAALLARLRAEGTRVHAITNAAAGVLTANLLLAAGGVPSLTVSASEVADFARRAGALLVNLGTLDAERRAAIPVAAAAAREAGRPVVLDPVFVEASPGRLAFARDCLATRPTVLRLNAAEFAALAGAEAAPDRVAAFARAHRTVVALTGPTDLVTDGNRHRTVANGHPLMAKVTAMGCAATALVAGFAALSPDDPVEAAASALAVIGVAGELAGEAARGPGSFVPAFLDALHGLDAGTLAARARIAP
jgi:hydroxyethylthiazole kinase